MRRRDFIRTATVSSLAGLLAGCGSDNSTSFAGQPAGVTPQPTATPSQLLDALVVGAGPAGISAARSVQATGRTVLVLEAQDVIGGRCRTDSTTFPVPFDYGAQFMGQVASLNNVLFPLAQQLGFTMIPSEQVPAGFFDPVSGLTADSTQLATFLATFAQLVSAIQTTGLAISTGVTPDLSVQDLLRSAGLQNAPFISLALQFAMEVIDGGSAATQSVQDLFDVVQFIPATFVFPQKDSFFVPAGFGTFMARLAKGLPIQTSRPVTSIDTSGTNVVVTAGGQQYTARTVIVTTTVNVLKSGSIAFNPPLPSSHQTALSQILMGHAYKAELEFRSNPFNGRLGVQPGQTFQSLALQQGNSPTFFVNYFAEQYPNTPNTYVMCIVEAEQGLAFEQMGPAAAGAALCALMDKPYPGASAAWTGRILASNWASNPYTRGCLSFCTPGNAQARTQLMQPIGNKMWLAGEAITVHAHSLVHGAWASGEQAAYAAMASIGALSRIIKSGD